VKLSELHPKQKAIIKSIGDIGVMKNTFKEDMITQLKALKEAFVNAFLSMSNIQMKSSNNTQQPSILQYKLRGQFASPLAAFSYLVFILLYIPCVSTIAAIKTELGMRWMLFETVLLPLVAYAMSVLVYQLGSRFF